MKRALILSAIPPLPAHAGNRARILSLSRAIRSLGFDVHLAWLRTWPDEQGDMSALAAEYGAERVHVIEARPPAFPRGRLRIARRLLRRLGQDSAYAFALDDWYDPQVTPALQALHRKFGFHVAIAEYVFLSAALEAFPPPCRKLIDTHDIFTERNRKPAGGAPRLSWYSTSAQEEEAGLRRADAVLAIQDEEASALRARLGDRTQVATVSHILDGIAPLAPAACNAASFLAAGNEANLAAYDHFRRAILPLILRRLPDFQLHIGGAICARLRPALGVKLVGPIAEPAELFARAPIAVNPVRHGTGISIKLLDALGCGIPTVTSRTGARGMRVDTLEAMRVVEDRDDAGFAEAVVSLLTDEPARIAASRAAIAAAHRWNTEQLAALRKVLS